MKTVGIIGRTGQLGGALVQAAAQRHLVVAAPDRTTLDITRAEQVRAFLDTAKPDVVVNTTAITSPVACEQDAFSAYRVHAAAVYTLAYECRVRGIRLVTVSTDYVFDGTKGTAYVETDVPHPLQAYGASKHAGEAAALAAHPEGAYVIRTSALYGGQGSPTKGNFVLAMRDKMQRGEAPQVVADIVTSPTYAGHLAEALLQLLETAAPAGIYHLAGSGEASWYTFACAIQRTFALETAPVATSFSPGSQDVVRPRFTPLTNTRAAAFGITLPPWEDGLAAYRNELSRV